MVLEDVTSKVDTIWYGSISKLKAMLLEHTPKCNLLLQMKVHHDHIRPVMGWTRIVPRWS